VVSLAFSTAAHDACFPAGLLAFSKLLKLHQTEGRISSNLLKRKQSSRKTSAAGLSYTTHVW